MAGGGGDPVKAILFSFFATLGISIAKGVAWIFTGSGSMLAEAIHSLADCTNQLLLLLGLKRSEKPATPDHPFGYGKAVFFWSFIVAMLLFSMGGMFSVYGGVKKILQPEELKMAWVALIVLGVSIGLEVISLWGAMREINKMRGDKTMWQWLRESRSAEMVVIWGEDVAALLGLVLAFIFVLLATLTGNPVFDGIGSVVIGVMLLLISVFLFTRVKALLIGRSADPDIQAAISKIIEADGNIQNVLNTLTMQIGPNVMLAAKIKMKPGLKVDDAARAINKLETELKATFPEIKWSFIEPDVAD